MNVDAVGRCETCRYWGPYGDWPYGECGCKERHGLAWPSGYEDFLLPLHTQPSFGCVCYRHKGGKPVLCDACLTCEQREGCDGENPPPKPPSKGCVLVRGEDYEVGGIYNYY